MSRNFLCRWKIRDTSKPFTLILSDKQIKEMAREIADKNQLFLKTGAGVKTCARFIGEQYTYFLIEPYRGVLRPKTWKQEESEPVLDLWKADMTVKLGLNNRRGVSS